MKSLNKITIIVFLLVLTACNNKSPIKQIDILQNRLAKAEKQLRRTDNDFNFLVKEYARLDTTLPRKIDINKKMQLLQAYLQQYEDERVNVKKEIAYSYSQLSDLKDDLQNNLYDEAKKTEYINAEEAAIHKTESIINYFKDRFKKQKKVIKNLKNQ